MDTGKPVDIRPYKPFKAVQAMSPEDMNAYYDEVRTTTLLEWLVR